jgi:hypothetical protein
MAKRKKYKVGDTVEFSFAGAKERGKITMINEVGRLTINDGKYTYPVEPEKVVSVIK